MNVRLFGMAAAMMAAMGVVACGDDTGDGAGGAGGEATSTDSSSSTGTPSSSSTEGAGGDPTGGGGGGGDITGGGGEGGTAVVAGPCADECADDAGCDEAPANPEDGGDCQTCVVAEADKGTASSCAVTGALGPCCQDNDECSEYVSCVLADGETCGEDFPEGSARASECVLNSCGDCGTPS